MTVRVVGTAAVLLGDVAALCYIATAAIDPWWIRLIFAGPLLLFLLAGGYWMMSGLEQGSHLEMVDGDKRLSLSNLNVFAQWFTRGAIEAFFRPTAPRPFGQVGPGGPADEKALIATSASLPNTVIEGTVVIPEDAVQVPGLKPSSGIPP